jgi:hypothetical protein
MTDIDPAEAAEQTIDFLEELGYPLQPWQATTLRAMLNPLRSYPVGTHFVVNPQHPQPKGFRPSFIVSDEACICSDYVDSECPVHNGTV